MDWASRSGRGNTITDIAITPVISNLAGYHAAITSIGGENNHDGYFALEIVRWFKGPFNYLPAG